MRKLYKYLGPDLLGKVLPPGNATYLKASRPKEFNDPYELFLTLKAKGLDPEVLAFYQETVGELPQWPTLCFSKRPDVVPMWAHYARECSGFVVEIDEDLLLKTCPDATVEDITYGSDPATIDSGMVAHALATSKPRHTYFLQRAAIAAAYFAKSSVWGYEAERRVVVGDNRVMTSATHMLLRLPAECVTAVIAGPQSSSSLVRAIKKVCTRIGCRYFRMHIARSAMRPYFSDSTKQSVVFDDEQLSAAKNSCADCREPIDDDDEEKCPWCSITESHRMHAARYNPMRRLAHYGLLDQYLADVGRIGTKAAPK
jgi:hypothetical protein